MLLQACVLNGTSVFQLHVLPVVSVMTCTGSPKWKLSLESPIVSLFLWTDSQFHQVPIATVSKSALRHISSSTALAVRTKSSIIQAEDHLLL